MLGRRFVIDGTVNGIGTLSRSFGSVLKLLQSGYIRSYAAWVVFGSVAAIVAISLILAGFDFVISTCVKWLLS